MSNRIGFWIAHFNVLAVTLVLAGAFGVQFLEGELPCPLCILQRMGMMLCALGPVLVILKARGGGLPHRSGLAPGRLGDGDVAAEDFAAAYGMSALAAIAGASVSARQILLHIVPPDKGYGDPMFGLHLYSWAFVVFVTVLADAGLNLIFIRQLVPRGVRYGAVSKAVVGAFAAIVLANTIAVFFEEGFHWVLPDDPPRYQLLHDFK